jgi:hypothetical protein
MNHSFRYVAIVLALGACCAMAGASAQQRPLPDPADAGAPVPPTRYAPAMPPPPAAQPTSPPTETWKALNQVVAAGDAMSVAMDTPEPKKKEIPPPDPHAGHRHKDGQ